jgi:hypothetical protein
MWGLDQLSVLIGKTLKNIETSKDEVVFHTECGEVHRYGMDSDCCSVSWFEGFEGLETAIGKKVVAVEETELPNRVVPPPTRQECEKEYYYAVKLEDAPPFIIIGRNESNGYYGGWIYKIGN